MREAKYYAYRVDGPPPSGDRFERHAFNPRKILLDPYSRGVFFPPAFDRRAAVDLGAHDGRAPLDVLSREAAPIQAGLPIFDATRRPRHDSALVIYEMHLRGFTHDASSDVPERGAARTSV